MMRTFDLISVTRNDSHELRLEPKLVGASPSRPNIRLHVQIFTQFVRAYVCVSECVEACVCVCLPACLSYLQVVFIITLCVHFKLCEAKVVSLLQLYFPNSSYSSSSHSFLTPSSSTSPHVLSLRILLLECVSYSICFHTSSCLSKHFDLMSWLFIALFLLLMNSYV